MQIIIENKKTYISGLISEANKRNGNERIYPEAILKPAILDLAERVAVNPQSIYAEKEHPKRGTIDETKACGLLVEVKWNDLQKNAWCKVEIIEHTDAGRKLLQTIKSGKSIGISTRGAGSLSSDNIVENIHFFTADIVDIPSCQNCYLSESTGEMIPNDYIFEYDSNEKEDTVIGKFESEVADIAMENAFRGLL